MTGEDVIRKYQALGVSFRLADYETLTLSLPVNVRLSDSDLAELKQRKPDIILVLSKRCPAMDRATGICYGVAWFDAKSTAEKKQCDPDSCRWKERWEERSFELRGM